MRDGDAVLMTMMMVVEASRHIVSALNRARRRHGALETTSRTDRLGGDGDEKKEAAALADDGDDDCGARSRRANRCCGGTRWARTAAGWRATRIVCRGSEQLDRTKSSERWVSGFCLT